MTRKVIVSVECEIDDRATEEQIVEQVEAALRPLAAHLVSAGNVEVTSPRRDMVANIGADDRPDGGYSSRLWSKAF